MSSLLFKQIQGVVQQDLDNKGVAIVLGGTGSGKSTLVPVALSEMYPGTTIIVAQKRRIAAKGLYFHVAKTMGTNVGYAIGG